ncbi:MAG: lactonase family protein [Chitinophagaceae bacterium]|nr:lactonase family protein [Chitinophagaceae bacterium]
MLKHRLSKTVCVITFILFYITGTAQTYYMLVGTYDSPKSEGIYVYEFDSKAGIASAISHIKTSNPSYLAVSPEQKFVYAVNENADSTGKGGQVSSFSFNKKAGTLFFLGSQSSEGNHPCYISVDKSNRWVFAGNYSSGNLSVLPVNKYGKLSKSIQVIQHEGSGADTIRQKTPHVHGIFLKKKSSYVYVTDLGTDKIMIYYQNNKNGKLYPSKLKYVSVSTGGGPRHLDFHPKGKFVYLLNELSGSVSVFRDWGNGNLEEIQTHSSLPLTYKGKAGAADIHVSADGKFLYASNRAGANSIAIFSIEQKTGTITLVGHQYTEGEAPRNFNFDPTGKFLLVANQNSDEIVVFRRDVHTGLLTDTNNRIKVGKPVCIKWINVK